MSVDFLIFQLLILLLPTQLGLHFWPSWAYVYGIRVDYLSPTIFLTDIVVIALMFAWFIKIKKIHKKLLVTTAFIIVLAFINILFSSHKPLTAYKWLKVVEMMCLGFYVSINWPRIKNGFSRPMSLAVIYSAAIAWFQFFLQRSTNFTPLYLLGERRFTPTTPGISLFEIFGRELLRPYATFPHPNVLAGFMLVAMVSLLFNKKRGVFENIAISLAAITLILSFSQNAWIAGLLVLTLSRLKKYYKKMIVNIIFWGAIICSVSLPLVGVYNKQSGYSAEVKDRLELAVISGRMFSSSPFFGVGLGDFIPRLPDYESRIIWWLQPVHNIFLLVLSEVGLVGILLFLYLLFVANKYKNLSLMAIILTGTLDHYWLTIQQTQLLFSIVVGMAMAVWCDKLRLCKRKS